jgi:hypothetical protein
MIPGVPHGWDKAPNPVRVTPGVKEQYLKACKELKRLLTTDEPLSDVDSGVGSQLSLAMPEEAHTLDRSESEQPFLPEQDFRTSWFRTSWSQ